MLPPSKLPASLPWSSIFAAIHGSSPVLDLLSSRPPEVPSRQIYPPNSQILRVGPVSLLGLFPHIQSGDVLTSLYFPSLSPSAGCFFQSRQFCRCDHFPNVCDCVRFNFPLPTIFSAPGSNLATVVFKPAQKHLRDLGSTCIPRTLSVIS